MDTNAEIRTHNRSPAPEPEARHPKTVVHLISDSKSSEPSAPSPTSSKSSKFAGSGETTLMSSTFGSAENDIAAVVAADITECERVNGVEDFFASTEARVREKFNAAYKVFRHASCDPAYCAALAKKLHEDSGGNYAPSAKKPWCLAAFLALKPATERHAKQTYEASYFFQHAAIDDVPLDNFTTWIKGRNLKESIAFVRSRKNRKPPKATAYPCITKAKQLKNHSASTKILKAAFDMAEEELKKLFDSEAIDQGSSSGGESDRN